MRLSNHFPEKIKQILTEYRALRFQRICSLEDVLATDTVDRSYRTTPNDLEYHFIRRGDTWGASGVTTWFVCKFQDVGPNTFLSFEYICGDMNFDVQRAQQALVFANGNPIGGLDRNHSHVLLPEAKTLDIAVEFYPFHDVPGNQPHEHGRIVGKNTRTFQSISLSKERRAVADFILDLEVLFELLEVLPEGDFFRVHILQSMGKVFQVIDSIPSPGDEARLQQQMEAAREFLSPLMSAKNAAYTPTAYLTAHAHIDTAWQWDIAETTRKCARTFSTVLNLMDRYPEFTFTQSQPYQLERMAEYPELYKRILQRIEEGRWELNGAMYIEPDLNMPSGEALVRQLLYGQSSIYSFSGKYADTLWVPDTFGFSAALPQLMRRAGISYFSSSKLSGNDSSPFPYNTFRWIGIDGSAVTAHLCAIETGTGPKVLTRQWNQICSKEGQSGFLKAFGHGDGGGGPTADMLETARRTRDIQGCPKTFQTSLSGFMHTLNESELPVYQDELYLQAHRGTYTSVSRIKQLNRRLENRFREAEYILTRAALNGQSYPREKMDALWKEFLVCQFHDILPGTAIEAVNHQAEDTMLTIEKQLTELMDLTTPETTLTIHNVCSHVRTRFPLRLPDNRIPIGDNLQFQPCELLDGTTGVMEYSAIAPFGAERFLLKTATPVESSSPFCYSDNCLTTPLMTVRFALDGAISSLCDNDGREYVKTAFNRFFQGEDVPTAWDNWDIDIEQSQKMTCVCQLLERKVVSDGSLRMVLRSRYALGDRSFLEQDMVFYHDSMQIDFVSRLDWHQKRTLLKVHFDTTIQSKTARHEIQFGHISRPTHQNEAPDWAKFEVCSHRWSDLSQADCGVAVLNDCKYGVSVQVGDIALTLLKSSVHPDSRGDEGMHSFTYSVLPHIGNDLTPVICAARELNSPPLCTGRDDTPHEALVSTDSPTVSVEAIKPTQNGDAIVIRLSEQLGGYAKIHLHTDFAVSRIYESDLLERIENELDFQNLELTFQPFQVRTFLLVPAASEVGE